MADEITGAVILKDRDGNDVTYANANGDVPTIKLDTPDGGTQTYIKGETEETTVTLDFSNGDMEVVPDIGKLFSKVLIPVPENMSPENIPVGMNIAGIIGTFAGMKIASGVITTIDKTTSTTVTHGLGVIPDIIIIASPQSPSGSKKGIPMGISMSQAFADLIGTQITRISAYYNDSTGTSYANWNSNHDITSSVQIASAGRANENTFIAPGSTTTRMNANSIWCAIAGLT